MSGEEFRRLDKRNFGKTIIGALGYEVIFFLGLMLTGKLKKEQGSFA